MDTRTMITLAIALTLAACDEPAAVEDAGHDAGASIDDAGHDAGETIDDAGSDAGSTTEVAVVRDFSSEMFEFPESVALHGGAAFVTFALDGRVGRVTPEGEMTIFGTVPIPAPMSAFALGITMGPDGAAYVALAKADPAGAAIPGVYRIPPEGGAGALYASHPMINVPSDVKLDAGGNLWVTEAPTGVVFRAAPGGGTAEIWLDDPLLDPAPTADGPCGPRGSPFPIGANGIVVEDARVIVNNTESASLVTIPIEADGSAGTPVVLVTSCELLAGTDGLSPDASDGWLTTVQSTHALVRIAEDGALTELHRGDPLSSPAAVDVGDFGGSNVAVIASSAFGDLFAGQPTMPSLAALAR